MRTVDVDTRQTLGVYFACYHATFGHEADLAAIRAELARVDNYAGGRFYLTLTPAQESMMNAACYILSTFRK